MKKIIYIFLVCSLIICGCNKSNNSSNDVKIVVADNQTLVTGQVTEIYGNDITIALAEENGAEERSETDRAKESTSDKLRNKSSEVSTKTESNVVYQLTGETKNYRIPVGTTVTTMLGTTTTFSMIAAQDMLKLVTEEDEDGNVFVVAVYIVG